MGKLIKNTSKFVVMALGLLWALTLLLIFTVNDSFSAFATETDIITEFSDCKRFTIEDNFSDDSVLVMMDKNSDIFSELFKSNILQTEAFDSNITINVTNKIEIKSVKNLSARSRSSSNQIVHLQLNQKSKQNVLDTIDKLKTIRGITHAEPNLIDSGGVVNPDDNRFRAGEQWGLNGTNGIDASAAWGLSVGSRHIRIGVIDSGIATHNDLNANVDRSLGRDFWNNDNATNDDIGGHGTHCAGIIGAAGNNALGITGVAQNISLVPLQTAYDTSGSGSHYANERIAAIEYATELWNTNQRIHALSYSILGFGNSTALLSAIADFPGLFIHIAGNKNDNVDNRPYTSQFNLPNLISVGALNENGTRRSTSNYSSSNTNVSIYAPGTDILSTMPGNA